MPASPAQIRANQANAAKSTGPKTPEGKEQSRQNALKHGLTGAGVVLPPEDKVEVDRRFVAFQRELQPTSELSLTLVRRLATLAVRMEKCSDREMAATRDRVVRALTEFVPPEGASEAEISRLRDEVIREAEFDPSKEACLHRRYEASAERGFFRALKEIRQIEREKESAGLDEERKAEIFRQELGSILEMKKLDDEMDALYPELAIPEIPRPRNPANSYPQGTPGTRVDVPITVGRGR
jgi:hypothetical protein